MAYVLGFLLGCCLGVGLYLLEIRDKIYFKFKGFIEEKYGKTATMTINVCLWIMVWITYFGGVMITVHILKPLL
jgi:hypothetical protein